MEHWVSREKCMVELKPWPMLVWSTPRVARRISWQRLLSKEKEFLEPQQGWCIDSLLGKAHLVSLWERMQMLWQFPKLLAPKKEPLASPALFSGTVWEQATPRESNQSWTVGVELKKQGGRAEAWPALPYSGFRAIGILISSMRSKEVLLPLAVM